MFDIILVMVDATLRVSTPLIFAALAGLFSERAGIVNIALEGKLLLGAFAAAAAAYFTGSAWLGVLAAIGVGVLFAWLHAFATVTHRGDHVVSGLAINILAAGLTVTLARHWFDMGGQTPSLTGLARFRPIELPLVDLLNHVPILGTIYREVISGHTILVYMSWFAVPLVWWTVFRTRFGLRLRAVGENPQAIDTAGIGVTKMRYLALTICGALAGIGGAYLSIAHSAQFIPDMSAGKGYMALAALIFGKWRPVQALAACFLFGFLEAVAIRLQGVEIGGVIVPVQFIEMLPYVLTVVLLAGFIGRAIAPKSIGKPYAKERT
ncbi:ABC transporter permease [Salinispirillum sp. LH 10-3-1]|uniref:ABC transporter permease n=1 Tax=Salinispirillum sp. LH 10-3-1 TaxID=2952525 RepID=A0AB38YG10_9GAMM